MKTDKEKAIESLQELEEMLADRIIELKEITGRQGERHVFIFYRDKTVIALEYLKKTK